jgi:hypothetical protein
VLVIQQFIGSKMDSNMDFKIGIFPLKNVFGSNVGRCDKPFPEAITMIIRDKRHIGLMSFGFDETPVWVFVKTSGIKQTNELQTGSYPLC